MQLHILHSYNGHSKYPLFFDEFGFTYLYDFKFVDGDFDTRERSDRYSLEHRKLTGDLILNFKDENECWCYVYYYLVNKFIKDRRLENIKMYPDYQKIIKTLSKYPELLI